ncbi:hypothetical protein ONZ45_g17759 [Pleurotus djamor]|nr:hypothetical protein ONZ45_g17759 [Pleurotus djamor]
MAPGRPVSSIKVRVPRHNAQRLGAKLNAQVQSIVKTEGIVADTYQPTHDSVALSQAIESASDWNSLLITARAQRGPQWDIGTQQFLVDEGSELFYDPAPLLEVVRKETEDETKPEDNNKPPMHHQPPPGIPRDRDFPQQHGHIHLDGTPQHQRHPGASYPYGVGVGASPMRQPGQYPGAPGVNMGVPPGGVAPFNPVQAAQFYNPGDAGSPMRMGMGMDQGHGGLPMQHPGMHGGMGMVNIPPTGMPMHMTPDMRQRMPRGMGDFGPN